MSLGHQLSSDPWAVPAVLGEALWARPHYLNVRVAVTPDMLTLLFLLFISMAVSLLMVFLKHLLLYFFCFFCGIRDSLKAPSQLAAETLREFGFGFTSKQLLFEPVPVTGYRSPHPSSPRLLGYVRLR